MKPLARISAATQLDSDLVVRRGVVVKNRYGATGGTIPLPDGYYRLVVLAPLRRTRTHKRTAKARATKKVRR